MPFSSSASALARNPCLKLQGILWLQCPGTERFANAAALSLLPAVVLVVGARSCALHALQDAAGVAVASLSCQVAFMATGAVGKNPMLHLQCLRARACKGIIDFAKLLPSVNALMVKVADVADDMQLTRLCDR